MNAALLSFCLLLAAAPTAAAAPAGDWPGEKWPTASPAELGMDESQLARARDYALTGGGSGCVVFRGKQAIAWGSQTELYDLKSSSKSIGVTLLGIAMNDGKVRLDDPASVPTCRRWRGSDTCISATAGGAGSRSCRRRSSRPCVPQDRVRDRTAYEFFVKLDDRSEPTWTADIARRGAVFSNPGNCYRSHVSYNAGLRRYLWCQINRGSDTRFAGGCAIYDAPQPWGPWTTAFYTDRWDVGPGESSSLPTKWMSGDGRTVHLVFSGDDCFSVRQATLD